MRFIGRFHDSSPEWREVRVGRLGGSQVGAVLGVNPWESAVTCFLKVTGQIPSEIPESELMRLGKLLEWPLVQNFMARHPDVEVEYQPGSFTHDDYGWALANPDGFIRGDDFGILEIKYSPDFWSEPPLHYVAQVDWYMWITGASYAVIAGLIGGRFQEFRIERDEFRLSVTVERMLAFYALVTEGEQPEWDGSDSTYQSMRLLYSDVNDEGVELGSLGEELRKATEAAKISQEYLNEQKSKTLALMQDARFGLLNGERICYRQKASNGSPFLKMK